MPSEIENEYYAVSRNLRDSRAVPANFRAGSVTTMARE